MIYNVKNGRSVGSGYLEISISNLELVGASIIRRV